MGTHRAADVGSGCRVPASWEATPPTVRHQLHEFTPTAFYNEFSATTPPVLRIEPGDTIRTATIDAAGTDDRGVTRGKAGNPQSGPFYVVGAAPGETVAVHVTRLRLNRDWAISTARCRIWRSHRTLLHGRRSRDTRALALR